jgi:hypothetical protein
MNICYEVHVYNHLSIFLMLGNILDLLDVIFIINL